MARSKTKLTEEQRRERREAQQRHLEQALDRLTTTEGWRRWLRTRATLHRYSLRNTLLLAHQAEIRRMQLTHVAGFRAWLKLGRYVRKGERGLSIWAPMRVRDRDSDDPDAKRTIFRPAAVFDVSQTEPLPDTEPAPLEPPGGCAPIDGDSHAHLHPRLEQLARGIGYRVGWPEEIPGEAKGLCDRRPERRQISVLAGLAPNERVAVLIHELCHALLGDGDQTRGMGRALEEVVVESASYVACATAGLAIDMAAVPYVASWAGERDPATVVREAAALIDELARTIETALQPEDDQAEADGESVSGTEALA